jgi:hypothetical protein
LGLQADSLVTTPQARVTVTFAGFEGDRHAGLTRKSDSRTPFYPRGTEIRHDRQVSLVSVEELAQVAAAMHLTELPADWIGANLLLQGIPRLSQLPPMTRLFFSGGVVLLVSGENHPCLIAGRAIQDSAAAAGIELPGLAELFPKAAKHRRGLVATVELPGVIHPSESVEARLFDYRPYPLD